MSQSSNSWRTPDRVFNNLYREFAFTVDAAASATNAKPPRFWSHHDNALRQDWRGERIFCNPPHSDIPQPGLRRYNWRGYDGKRH
ncbi:DNA N-6-adenine-methyltransferase [Brenneria goodwinii]|uniref:DNA N-6-adenine-methyltransferase n=1 Tax=Brenneria goodwinii TaxID=1109412 RepID=UPI0036F3D44A